ncbi:hypothetical protein ACFQ51_55000 [Streptomyces kaempferi]
MISDSRADFDGRRLWRVLGASRAGYYRHLATEQVRAERRAAEKRTVSETHTVHAEHLGACEVPTMVGMKVISPPESPPASTRSEPRQQPC